MENAAKALIIAAGMLLAILILTLVLYAWSSISEYQKEKYELQYIENVAKFNEQFAQYDRNDVAGYELISLANKVADYNAKYSKLGTNNDGYNPITMTIDFLNNDKLKKLTYDDTIRLFKSKTYSQGLTKNEIEEFIKTGLDCETAYGTEECISRISKNINSIFIKDFDSDTAKAFLQKKEALRKFYDIVPMTVWDGNLKLINIYKDSTKKTIDNDKVEGAYAELTKDNRSPNRTIKTDVYKYYEYTQFKRCIFKCTNMEYNNETSRIEKIEYKFVKIR